ncbi:MAG: hypothetical protein IT181_13070 [Acidobacteria bacterium]|nr:hypothetical protein [Acidobacteriota bacterium]
MDPNTQHQLWSRWDVTVTPPKTMTGPAQRALLEEMRTAWARFVRRAFVTTTGQVRLERRRRWLFSRRFTIFAQARLEGAPAHDPQYRDVMKRRIVTFFGSGFGSGTQVRIDVRIEAGDLQDGQPAAQMIVLPTLTDGATFGAVNVDSSVAGPEALVRG